MARSLVRRRLGGTARHITVCVLAGCAVLAGGSGEARAQSTGDLAAWDALVVTPVGALPPRVHDLLFGDSARAELSVRYGRWRYDIDDAIHNDFGVTLSRQLGIGDTGIALTAGYLSLSCGTCKSWLSGGIEVQTRLIRQTLAGDSLHEVAASLGVRASAGAARFLGDGRATATSIAGAASIGMAFPLGWSSRMSVAVLPGLGIGRFSSVDEDAYGTRPTFGASMAWALPKGIVVDLGLQRVYIEGGPTLFGGGLSWVHR
jgi:hypothetical protein